MTTRYPFIISVLLIQLLSCSKKEAQQEPLEFTKVEHDYTAISYDKSFDHIKFTDITAEARVDFTHQNGALGKKWMPETLGSGGGFLDYDNDGWIDIFLTNSTFWPNQQDEAEMPTPGLFRNRGDGTFEDVTAKAGLNFSLYGMGVSFADFDADGDVDIYLTAIGSNKLLQNDNGYFKDVTARMKVEGNGIRNEHTTWSTGVAWVDIDRDGWLDLFVDNYVRWTPETDIYTTRDGKTKSYATPDVYEGETCRLYRNVNGKYFEDITEKAGVLNNEGKSLGVAIADFNNDLSPDIVVSNDTQPNFLYINNGDGSFTNKAIMAGIAFDESGRARAGMGVDVADFENSGKQAIAIGNFSQEPLSLYTQTQSTDLFRDQAGAVRLTSASLLQLTFGLRFADLDLDGYPELIAANGHIEPEINSVQMNITFAQNPQIFYNDRGKFIDISDRAGDPFRNVIVGRGVATGDIDQDGDLDVLITVNGGKPKLLRNDTEHKNQYIQLKLIGKNPNFQAIGAKIYVWTNGMRQQRLVSTGSSYLSQSDISTLIFGLGQNTQADSVFVHWPTTGNISRLLNIPAGEMREVEE